MRSIVATRMLNEINKKKRRIMKENILRLYYKLLRRKSAINSMNKFKTIVNLIPSFDSFNNYAGMNTGCRYLSIQLIPTLSLDIDSQMNSTWKATDGTIYPSVVGIGMEIRWLIFYTSFEINFKTNKPLEE